jgi:HAD superfamily hydrolase (TIGR01549 family)
MFFKGIIFDLDDTLYNYKKCNEKAYEEVKIYFINNKYKFNFDIDLELIKKNVKSTLNQTASSHNRFIYFKKIIEKNNIPYSEVIKINEIYWECFYKNMKLFEGVLKFLIKLKEDKKKIIILTDFQTEYQLIKLEKLNILNYIDYIITSEEIGIEKPSFKMFDAVIEKTKIKKEELIMIGDNFEKDIQGADNYGIYSYYLKKIKNFNNINIFFNNLDKDINDFFKMCKDFGNDFNLVQLGGGNISVKNNDLMIIKSSGVAMKDVNNFSIINNEKLLIDLKNKIYNPLNNYLLFNKNKPSIETYMHSILKKYTVHLHPIDINKILVRKNAYNIIKNMYPNALILNYISPGINIAKKLLEKELNNINIIFLLNHGVIYTSDNLEEIYKMVNFKNEDYICQDIYLNENIELVKKYFDKYAFPDAVIYLKDNYYIKEKKIYLKDKKYEEILKANIMILEGDEEINFLKEEEINFLINREDEKYRKNI